MLACKFYDVILKLITEQSVVETHHIFFIHSSVEEHLDCFQFMGIMNQATVTLIKHMSFGMMKSPLGTCPRVVYLDLKLD